MERKIRVQELYRLFLVSNVLIAEYLFYNPQHYIQVLSFEHSYPIIYQFTSKLPTFGNSTGDHTIATKIPPETSQTPTSLKSSSA